MTVRGRWVAWLLVLALPACSLGTYHARPVGPPPPGKSDPDCVDSALPAIADLVAAGALGAYTFIDHEANKCPDVEGDNCELGAIGQLPKETLLVTTTLVLAASAVYGMMQADACHREHTRAAAMRPPTVPAVSPLPGI